MTILPDINERNLLNIDTLEKAFVWSALALHKIARLHSNESFRDYVKYSHRLSNKVNGQLKPVLFVEIKLPYNFGLFVSNGGNLHLALQELSLGDISQSAAFLPDTNPSLPLEPIWVNTLERYVLWTAYELTKASLTSDNGLWDVAVNDILGGQSYVQISASLYIDFEVFLSNRSYVDALGVSSNIPSLGLGNTGTLSNTGTLGN